MTDTTGTIEFSWAPVSDLGDPETWRSTVVMSEQLEPNEILAATAFDCLLEQRGLDASAVTLVRSASHLIVQRTGLSTIERWRSGPS